MYHLSISIMPATNVAFISRIFSNIKYKFINFIHNTKYYNCKHADANIQNQINELDNNSKTAWLPSKSNSFHFLFQMDKDKLLF